MHLGTAGAASERMAPALCHSCRQRPDLWTRGSGNADTVDVWPPDLIEYMMCGSRSTAIYERTETAHVSVLVTQDMDARLDHCHHWHLPVKPALTHCHVVYLITLPLLEVNVRIGAEACWFLIPCGKRLRRHRRRGAGTASGDAHAPYLEQPPLGFDISSQHIESKHINAHKRHCVLMFSSLLKQVLVCRHDQKEIPAHTHACARSSKTGYICIDWCMHIRRHWCAWTIPVCNYSH